MHEDSEAVVIELEAVDNAQAGRMCFATHCNDSAQHSEYQEHEAPSQASVVITKVSGLASLHITSPRKKKETPWSLASFVKTQSNTLRHQRDCRGLVALQRLATARGPSRRTMLAAVKAYGSGKGIFGLGGADKHGAPRAKRPL